jgi:hypothetical protein
LSVVGRPTVGSSFWQEQARRFGDLRQAPIRQSERHLGASYHPDGWNLDNFRSFRGRTADRWYLDHGTRQTVEDFKSIAGVCAVALGVPNSDTAWVGWLDCLRRESIDLKLGELTSSTRVREWRPAPDLELVATGLIVEPVEVRPDADAPIISFKIGGIDDVCGASERLSRHLADEAQRSEIQESTKQNLRRHATVRAVGGASLSGWTVTQGWEAEFVPEGPTAEVPRSVVLPKRLAALRKAVVEPLLTTRGWSTMDWAKSAGVDYNTASHYPRRTPEWRLRGGKSHFPPSSR